jgi:hypothetical protein
MRRQHELSEGIDEFALVPQIIMTVSQGNVFVAQEYEYLRVAEQRGTGAKPRFIFRFSKSYRWKRTIE